MPAQQAVRVVGLHRRQLRPGREAAQEERHGEELRRRVEQPVRHLVAGDGARARRRQEDPVDRGPELGHALGRGLGEQAVRVQTVRALVDGLLPAQPAARPARIAARAPSPTGSAAAASQRGAPGQASNSSAGASVRMAWTVIGTTGAPRGDALAGQDARQRREGRRGRGDGGDERDELRAVRRPRRVGDRQHGRDDDGQEQREAQHAPPERPERRGVGSRRRPSNRPYSATVVNSAAELTITDWVTAIDTARSRTSDARGLSTRAATNGRRESGQRPDDRRHGTREVLPHRLGSAPGARAALRRGRRRPTGTALPAPRAGRPAGPSQRPSGSRRCCHPCESHRRASAHPR